PDVGSGFGGKPVKRGTSVSDMNMDINKARGYEQARNIDDLAGPISRNIFFDSRNFAFRNCDVHPLIQPVGGINNMAAFQQQVVRSGVRSGLGIGYRGPDEA